MIGALSLASCSNEKQQGAMVAANVFALETAESLNIYLSENEECPGSLDGWKVEIVGEDSEFSTFSGSDEIKYPVRATCKKDRTFSIDIKYSFDSGTWVTGGVAQTTEISYGHFTDLQTLEVAKNSDLNSVARQVVNGR